MGIAAIAQADHVILHLKYRQVVVAFMLTSNALPNVRVRIADLMVVEEAAERAQDQWKVAQVMVCARAVLVGFLVIHHQAVEVDAWDGLTVGCAERMYMAAVNMPICLVLIVGLMVTSAMVALTVLGFLTNFHVKKHLLEDATGQILMEMNVEQLHVLQAAAVVMTMSNTPQVVQNIAAVATVNHAATACQM